MVPIRKIALAATLAGLPAAALAHHGWSSYDEDEPVTLSGPLKEVEFGQPHGTAKMNWQDNEWDVVLAPVTRMNARGLNLEDIDDGERVTITGYVRSDGAREMRIERIAVGGKTVELR